MKVPSAGDQLSVKPGGVVIAVVSFALTRFLLADVVYGEMEMAVLSAAVQLLPLAGGLATVLYGVNLAVSTHSRRDARTIAAWYLLGTVGVAVLAGVPALGGAGGDVTLRNGSVIAGAVVGGGAVGVLVGVRSAATRSQREVLARQAEQSVLLNRLLRHEVLNSLTVIRGHSRLVLDDAAADEQRSGDAIETAIARIERTLDEIGFLVRTAGDTAAALGPVRMDDAMETCLDDLADAAPAAPADFPAVSVRADEHLPTLLCELLTLPGGSQTGVDRAKGGGGGGGNGNAGSDAHSGGESDESDRPDPAANVAVTTDDHVVTVDVSAPGSWLSDRARSVLVDGVPEYEHNDVDYGVPIVRLLVGQYGGSLDVEASDDETTVRVRLPRTEKGVPEGDSRGIGNATLWTALGIGLVAGALMGGVLHAATGSLAVIGSLYGASATGSGWIAHQFHSAVFSTVFAVATTKSRLSAVAESLSGSVALGVAYGVLLWLVAGGVVLGLWLNAVGIQASVPNLDPVSLAGHVVWGVSLGALAHLVPTSVVGSGVRRVRSWVAARLGRAT